MYICMYVYTIYVYTRPVSHPASQPSDYYRLDLIELSVRSNMRLSFHRPRESSANPKEESRRKNGIPRLPHRSFLRH